MRQGRRPRGRFDVSSFAFAVRACVLLLLLVIVFASATPAHAAMTLPNKMNYQGRLTDNLGNPLNGTYDMQFKLYDAASAGTLKWAETRTAANANAVTVTNGLFSVRLGEGTLVAPSTQLNAVIAANPTLYFEVTVGADLPMTPRQQVATTAYAFNSDTLDGIDSTGFIQNQTGSTQSADFKINGSGTLNTLSAGTSITLGGGATTGTFIWKNGTNSNTVTLQSGVTGTSYSLTLPTAVGATGDCIKALDSAGSLTFGSCGAAGSVTLYGNNIWAGTNTYQNTSTTAFSIQSASGAATLLVADTSTMNLTVGANASLTLTGGVTRPTSPTEGMLNYDTTTKQLLIYANGKWQGDRSTASKIVGTSAVGGTSGAAASMSPDSADYVNTSTTSAQTVINNALTAVGSAGGGTVYLMEGTYVIDGSISIPNNTTLTGAGKGSIIKFKNGINADFNGITNTDQTTGTNVTIRDLAIDGNATNQASGYMMGIYLTKMGSYSTYRNGALMRGLAITSVRGTGIGIEGSNNIVTENALSGMTYSGIFVDSPAADEGKHNIVSNNTIFNGIGMIGIYVNWAPETVVTSNTLYDLWHGIETYSDNVAIESNTLHSISVSAIFTGANNDTISGNIISDSGGTTNNDGIYLYNSAVTNTIVGNTITDTSCTSTCYAINMQNSTVTNTYISSNNISGPSAAYPATIHDVGTNTMFSNQIDGKGNIINKNIGALTVGTSTVTGTVSLQGGLTSVQLPTPTAPTITNSTTGGTTSYSYTVSALDGTGETMASIPGTTTTGQATLNSTDYNIITWAKVSGAVSYNVYRTASAGTPATTGLITSSSVAATGSATQSFNDTGFAGTVASSISNWTGGATFAGALQSATSLTLGTSNGGPATNGQIVMKNGYNNNFIILKPGGTTSTYSLTLPTAAGNSGDCLKALDNAGSLTFGSCGTVGAVTTVGALDGGGAANTSGATIASNTIYFQSASATMPGFITTASQTFTGDKIFKSASNSLTAFQIQDSSNASILLADASAGTIRIGTATNNITLSASGATYAGTARPTKTITLAPEYPGATFTGDGTNNTGSLSSDFCSSSSLLNTNSTVCGAATDEHNYYAWTTTQATAQDYDIYIRYRIPSDYDTGSMTNMKIFGWGTTSANEVVALSLHKASSTPCSTIANAIIANMSWNEGVQASPLGACTIAAGDMVTLKVHVVAGQNNTARAGEISFTYRSNL